MNKTNIIKVDGIGINFEHFGNMTEANAVKALEADRISNDPAWQRKAYAAAKKALEDSKKQPEQEAKKEEPKAPFQVTTGPVTDANVNALNEDLNKEQEARTTGNKRNQPGI